MWKEQQGMSLAQRAEDAKTTNSLPNRHAVACFQKL
jgi:hypothetical protein